MKSSIAILALASVGEATFNFNFRGAKPFTCPDNVDNTCVENQKNGFDFKELFPGSFSKYNDFDFKGWSCEDKFNKRTIKGECGPTKQESPSFGCTDKTFSVDHIEVTPEEDTDLEFHYDMADGSSCKTRHSCSRQGTTVKNNQCGGAKKVTIVYPPKKNKSKCKVDIGKIGFGCDKTKFPPPPPVYPPPSAPAPSTLSTIFSSAPATTVPAPSEPVYSQPPVQSEPPVVEVSSSAPASSAPASSAPASSAPASSAPASSAPASSAPASSAPASSAPPQQETSPAVSSSAVESTTSEAIPVQSEPVESEPVYSQPGYSQPPPPVSAPASSAPPQVSSSAVESTSTGVIPVQSQPVSSQPPVISEPPVVETTTFQSTSTIFTTTVATVTDCGPEHPECGSEETPVLVTVTVPQTTTVCDVTSTFTRPAVPTTEKPALPQTTTVPQTPETPEEPVTELPCDPVVPRCLITWLPLVPDCKDNTDAKCFCPKKEFIEKVFECLYAYGDNDEVVDQALKFVQGICADHVNENPAVVTGAETITKILTLPPVTATSVAYTTVTLDATLTVPCVEDGTTLSNSLTTTVIKSTIEVPKVEFATTAQDIVPVVPTAVPVQEGEGNKPTLIVAPSSTPAGTGGIVPVPTSGLPVAAGAGKLSAGVTAAVAVMVAMVAAF